MLLFFDDANKKLDDAGSNKPPHGKKKGKQDNKAKSGQRYAGYFRYRISADADISCSGGKGKGGFLFRGFLLPLFGIGGCLADDGGNSRETVLAVRANAGLADIVIRAGDIIVAVWTNSVHLRNRRYSYIRIDYD